MVAFLRCVKCKRWIKVSVGEYVICPHCGAKYIWKIRSRKYVYAGGGIVGNTRNNYEKDSRIS